MVQLRVKQHFLLQFDLGIFYLKIHAYAIFREILIYKVLDDFSKYLEDFME